MPEDNQNQSENQPQDSSDNHSGANIENTPPTIQAVEPKPKPEPSYGIIDEGRFWSLLKRSHKMITQ